MIANIKFIPSSVTLLEIKFPDYEKNRKKVLSLVSEFIKNDSVISKCSVHYYGGIIKLSFYLTREDDLDTFIKFRKLMKEHYHPGFNTREFIERAWIRELSKEPRKL